MTVEAARGHGWGVFDGVMLSDGSIHHNGGSYLDLQLSGEEHLDWLNSVKLSLLNIGLAVPADHPKVYDALSKGRAYKRTVLRSLSSPIMDTQYSRWYHNRTKIVPDDVLLTPATVANWFMGDGNSGILKKRPNAVRARLCTQGFSDSGVYRLIALLSQIGILGHAERCASGLVIAIVNTDSVNILMGMIEPYIVPSFSYKVKKPWKRINYPARRIIKFDTLRNKLRR